MRIFLQNFSKPPLFFIYLTKYNRSTTLWISYTYSNPIKSGVYSMTVFNRITRSKSNSALTLRIFSIILLIIAAAIFYLAFCCLAPYIVNTIPAGPYHGFITTLIYVIIGWCGGIGLPVILAIYAVILLFFSFYLN